MFPDFVNYNFPDWAQTVYAQAWLMGIVVGAMIRIFRAGLKWFRAVGNEGHSS